MFDKKLNFREHIQCKINMGYKMVGLIKRNFKYLSVSSFVLVYKNLVRSHLDYCYCVRNLYRKTDIETLEKLPKKRATKILPKLSHFKYSDRAFTTDDVIATVRRLPDKQCATDPLPTCLLKDNVDLLAPFITSLCHLAYFQCHSNRPTSHHC